MSEDAAKRTSKSVAVRIAGHEYKIRTEGDASALLEIAGYVDRAMARVRERTGTVDSLDVAVLTCLNLAREILALHGQQNAAVDEDRMRRLIDRVEAILGESASGEGGETDLAGVSVAAVSDHGAADATPVPDSSPRKQPPGTARTLDLPSVEVLRDRAASGRSHDSGEAGAEQVSPSALPEVRVASGGRERSS